MISKVQKESCLRKEDSDSVTYSPWRKRTPESPSGSGYQSPVGLLLNQEIIKHMLCTTLRRCVANLTVHTFGMHEDNILEG